MTPSTKETMLVSVKPQRWTIHACEDHGVQDCVLCGVFDVIQVVPEERALRAEDALRRIAAEGMFHDVDWAVDLAREWEAP